MPGGKTQLPPVYKRLLSLRWLRPAVENESNETRRQWKNFKRGNTFQEKQGVFLDRNGGLTKEQINFQIFRAGRETRESLFRGTQDGAFFPDIAPQEENFREEDIHQIRCMLSRSYRSYKVDRASVWKMLYYAELLMKGYTLQRLVSRGDFGVVYSATSNGVNCKACVEEEIAKDGAKTVGIKIIDKSDTHWYQVRNEIAAHASTSDHPNVLKLYQVFHTATAIYLVQEFADRGSLESVVPRKGFTQHECRELMEGILHGLQHLHRLDVVHRNLTCANILLTSQGTVKIAEFGLACVLPDRDFLLHQKVGTPGYMAPEVLRGLRYNGFLADIWTIGIVLYFLLHKFLPFTDEDLILHNCWRCLDFTFRSLSVELCLLLRSILQFRPTQRPSVESILRHNWFAQDVKPRVKPQVKDTAPPRPSVQPERLHDRISDPRRSPSVESVPEEPQKRDLAPCWANLRYSDGLNNERITLKSRLISHSQQDKINRLERKLNARSKSKTQRTPTTASTSLQKGVLPELGCIHTTKTLPVVGKEEKPGAPIASLPGQVPAAPILQTPAVDQTPTDVVSHEHDSGDGREKGVYCTALKCLRQIQQERVLFETPSSSLRSSLMIHIASLSEDDEDNDEEKKETDKATKTRKLEKDVEKTRDIWDKTEKKAIAESKDSVKKFDEEMSIEKSRASYEDALNNDGRVSEDITRTSPITEPSNRADREWIASSHQMKEESSEKRLVESIRALNELASSDGSIRSVTFPSYGSTDDKGSWARVSRHGVYAAQPSLEALDEVPAEYASGLDVEDEERLIRTQYYTQMDLPSTADDPLQAELHETYGRDLGLLMENMKSGTSGSVAENVLEDSPDWTPPPPDDEPVGGWAMALFPGLVASDNAPGLFHPELAIKWDSVTGSSASSDYADVGGLKETRTKSRTTVVSKAPSLRAITEERLAAGKGGGHLEKGQAQENLRKTGSFGKRAAEVFATSSSLGRLMTQSQIQIQEERSECAVWESISARGVSRGSYPKLAASFACEISLHSIVELPTEKDSDRLEQENKT